MGIFPPTMPFLLKLLEELKGYDIEFTASAFWQVSCQLAFQPTQGYAYVCEYPPDDGRSRHDGMVLKYDANHHTLGRAVITEIKRRGDDFRKGEKQAFQGARLALTRFNLDSIYAMTVHGSSFRCWQVMNEGTKIIPLHGGEAGKREYYIDVQSPGASQFDKFVAKVKEAPPLVIAPMVPSHAAPQWVNPDSATESLGHGYTGNSPFGPATYASAGPSVENAWFAQGEARFLGYAESAGVQMHGALPSELSEMDDTQMSLGEAETDKEEDEQEAATTSEQNEEEGSEKASNKGKGLDPTIGQPTTLRQEQVFVRRSHLVPGIIKFSDKRGRDFATNAREWEQSNDSGGNFIWRYIYKGKKVFWTYQKIKR